MAAALEVREGKSAVDESGEVGSEWGIERKEASTCCMPRSRAPNPGCSGGRRWAPSASPPLERVGRQHVSEESVRSRCSSEPKREEESLEALREADEARGLWRAAA